MLNLKYQNDIKLIATDFDGVMTDGGLYLCCAEGESYKKVTYRDIMGISVWLKNGGKFAIISGDSNQAIFKIAEKFDLEDIHMGIKDKGEVLLKIMQKYSLEPHEVCYIGDDINDISAFEKVKTAITVPNANYKIKKINDILITSTRGGSGVIREIVDSILD